MIGFILKIAEREGKKKMKERGMEKGRGSAKGKKGGREGRKKGGKKKKRGEMCHIGQIIMRAKKEKYKH